MNLNFYDLYKTYENEKLKDIIKNHSDYQNKAVETAILILKERNIYDKFIEEQEIQERQRQKQERKQQKRYRHKSNNLYLNDCNPDNQIYFDYGEEFDFERKLQKKKIKYYRRDFFHKRNQVVFYFPDSELEKLNKLINKLTNENSQPSKKYLKKITRPIDRFHNFFLKALVYLFIIVIILFFAIVLIDYLTDGKISEYIFINKK
jgi:hypothetical protein